MTMPWQDTYVLFVSKSVQCFTHEVALIHITINMQPTHTRTAFKPMHTRACTQTHTVMHGRSWAAPSDLPCVVRHPARADDRVAGIPVDVRHHASTQRTHAPAHPCTHTRSLACSHACTSCLHMCCNTYSYIRTRLDKFKHRTRREKRRMVKPLALAMCCTYTHARGCTHTHGHRLCYLVVK